MRLVRTIISVSGFSEAEVRAGLPDLFGEFRRRPWIICPDADWEAGTGRLIVTTHYEVNSAGLGTGAVLDEVQDCVVACISYSSEGIAFHVEESAVLPAA